MAKAKPITGLDLHAPVGKNARIIARERLAEMYEWSNFADDPYRVRELHDLRIAAKRLRYTLEVFEDVLPEECKAAVKELEQLQDELGSLHDSDVMIALLRLCLGAHDSGKGYEHALSSVQPARMKGRTLLRPEMVATVLDPAVAPSAEERYGLEQMLHQQEHTREQQYAAFRRHWHELQARDFRRHLLGLLDSAPSPQ
jgi:CHAD domain-containing protein